MDPAERLAAYLADELRPDERTALEAELARDAGLRAQLAAMRRADAALAELPPTALPAGADGRLRAAVARELDAQLGSDHPVVGDPDGVVRDLRPRRRWAAGIAAAAAAVVAVLAGVSVLTPGGDDTGLADGGVDDQAATMEATDDAAGVEEDGPADLLAAPQTGPVLVAGDRPLDEDAAAALLDAPELNAAAERHLGPEDGRALSRQWSAALGGTEAVDDEAVPFTADEHADDPAAGRDVPDLEATTEGRASVPRTAAGIPASTREEVATCLDVLLAAGEPAIPVYAELVVFEGDPAIAFGLLTTGPSEPRLYDRREVWVLSRDTCEVRYFTQR